MSATKTAYAPEIDLHDAAEVLHYAEELGVTELELREAIRNVGPRLDDVKQALADVVIHTQERHYDDLPGEEGGKLYERERAPGPRPD